MEWEALVAESESAGRTASAGSAWQRGASQPHLGTKPPASITTRLRGPSAGGSTNSTAWNGLMAGGWT